MTAYIRTLEEYLQKIQPEWDELFKRHRLTFVTHGNEKLLEVFEGLAVMEGKYSNNESFLLLKNHKHTCRIGISALMKGFTRISIPDEKTILFTYSSFGFHDVCEEWDLSPDNLTGFESFVNEINAFAKDAAKSIQFYRDLEVTLRQRMRG